MLAYSKLCMTVLSTCSSNNGITHYKIRTLEQYSYVFFSFPLQKKGFLKLMLKLIPTCGMTLQHLLCTYLYAYMQS